MSQLPLTTEEARAYHLGRAVLELTDAGALGVQFALLRSRMWQVTAKLPYGGYLQKVRIDPAQAVVEMAEEVKREKEASDRRQTGD
jgi:hypothetical protein